MISLTFVLVGRSDTPPTRSVPTSVSVFFPPHRIFPLPYFLQHSHGITGEILPLTPVFSLQHRRVLQVPYLFPVFSVFHTYQHRLGHILSHYTIRRHISLCPRYYHFPRPRLAKRLLPHWFLSDYLPTQVVEFYQLCQPSACHCSLWHPSFPSPLSRWPYLYRHLSTSFLW